MKQEEKTISCWRYATPEELLQGKQIKLYGNLPLSVALNEKGAVQKKFYHDGFYYYTN